jgi:nicotinamide mononucleotide transporter
VSFFDANTTFFTVPFFDYAMSYLEFFGTVLNLLTVGLLTRRNIINWPVGVAGTILFGILFYQIHLYADFFEQIFYFVTGIGGWLMWNRVKKDITTTHMSVREIVATVAVVVVGSIAASLFLLNIDTLLPSLFPDKASYAIIDATTTVMSFTAQYLLMRRKVENWYLWIAVDVVAIWLYYVKGIPFVSALYVVFLIMCLFGARDWRRKAQEGVAA